MLPALWTRGIPVIKFDFLICIPIQIGKHSGQSIPLNIAEGNGKSAEADRRRYFEIARGSALECAAIQDVLKVGGALNENEHQQRKNHLDRIAAMLSKLGGKGYCAKESQIPYGDRCLDPDSDSDFEPEKGKSQQGASADG